MYGIIHTKIIYPIYGLIHAQSIYLNERVHQGYTDFWFLDISFSNFFLIIFYSITVVLVFSQFFSNVFYIVYSY